MLISSLDIPPSAPSRSTPIAAPCCGREPQRAGSPDSPFTRPTSADGTHPSTPAEWTASMQDSLAQIFPLLAAGQESKAKAAAYGRKWSGWRMRFARGSSSSKTHLQLSIAGLWSSFPTLPPWGSMRAGVCSAQPPLVPRTFALGSGVSPRAPTLRANDAKDSAYQMVDGREVLTLTGVARMLPTLLASDSRSPGPTSARPGGPKLPTMIALMPTLCAANARQGPDTRSGKRGNGRNLPTLLASDWRPGSWNKKDIEGRPLRDRLKAAGGSLNPTWCEWFMGWPIGSTVSKLWATAKSRFKPPAPGACSGGLEA